MKYKNKKAQVWIETVVYTLIFLALMATVLIIAKPKIEQIKDRTIIEQTISSLNVLDNAILDARSKAAGTQIPVDFSIKRGQLIIDPTPGNEKIIMEIDDLKIKYSEYDAVIEQGNIKITTTKKTDKLNKIQMIVDYRNMGIDVTYNGKEEPKTFQKAPTHYKLMIKNNGLTEGKVKIDIYEFS